MTPWHGSEWADRLSDLPLWACEHLGEPGEAGEPDEAGEPNEAGAPGELGEPSELGETEL